VISTQGVGELGEGYHHVYYKWYVPWDKGVMKTQTSDPENSDPPKFKKKKKQI